MTRLLNKTVLITGASSGIGKASAQLFAREGARLLLCARRLDRIQMLAEALSNQYKVEVHCFVLDVRCKEAVFKAIQTLPAAWQSIDVLLNNAGLAAGLDTLQEGGVDDWEAMIDTNIKGLLYVTKAVLPGMIKRNEGHVMNIGSIAGRQVYPKGAVYCATKHAVNAINQGLRHDLLGTNIRVTSIDPGAVETEFSQVRFKGDKKRAAEVYEGFQPLCAEDIAEAVIFSASRPSHVNISEILIMPTAQAAASRVARKE